MQIVVDAYSCFLSDLNLHYLFFLPVLEAVFLSFWHVWLWVALICVFSLPGSPGVNYIPRHASLSDVRAYLSPKLLFTQRKLQIWQWLGEFSWSIQLTFLASLLSTSSSPAIPLDKPDFLTLSFWILRSHAVISLPSFPSLRLLKPL